MPVSAWIVIGATTVLALSATVSLALAAILGSISGEVSELLELEPRARALRKQAPTVAART